MRELSGRARSLDGVMTRSPRWWEELRSQGTAPDPRFTFANERTFLAWVRTSLALMAAGLGVEAFAEDLPEWSRTVLAGALVAIGGLIAASAFRRWQQAELALRLDEPLPPSRSPQVVSLALAGVALAVFVLVLLQD
jgi:putative membrane protein